MSPEIRINGELVASLPDESGTYITNNLGAITLDYSEINPHHLIQEIAITSTVLAGRKGETRRIQLSPSGKGSIHIRKGNKLEVALHEPIRKSCTDTSGKDWVQGWIHGRDGRLVHRSIWYNPRWAGSR